VNKEVWINGWLKTKLQAAGHRPANFSGHSFRSGGATDLWKAGTRPLIIKRAGRWLSEVYRLYIRDNPEATAAEIARGFALAGGTMTADELTQWEADERVKK
jgi:hypothetical protein